MFYSWSRTNHGSSMTTSSVSKICAPVHWCFFSFLALSFHHSQHCILPSYSPHILFCNSNHSSTTSRTSAHCFPKLSVAVPTDLVKSTMQFRPLEFTVCTRVNLNLLTVAGVDNTPILESTYSGVKSFLNILDSLSSQLKHRCMQIVRQIADF